MSPVFAVAGGDALTPVRVGLLLLIAADALAMFLTLRLARRLGCSNAAVAVRGLVWALAAYSLRTSLNGLQTSLAPAPISATFLALEPLRTPPGTMRGGGAVGA